MQDVIQTIEIPIEKISIIGDLYLPCDAKALIIFAHGSGSSRFSPCNQLYLVQLIYLKNQVHWNKLRSLQ